ADRKFRRAVPDGGDPPFRVAGGLEAVDALDQGAEQGVGLELRQGAADAGVDAVAPTELAAQVAADVEALRIVPLARVAVGGGEHQAAAGPGGHDVVADGDVLHGDAAGDRKS